MLLFTKNKDDLSNFSHFLSRRYAYYYCKTYKWIGRVQERYKAIPIDDEKYLLECARYIERNPIKAQIALTPDKYPHSSYHHYIGSKTNPLIDENPAFLGLDDREEIRQRIYEYYVISDRVDSYKKAKALQSI